MSSRLTLVVDLPTRNIHNRQDAEASLKSYIQYTRSASPYKRPEGDSHFPLLFRVAAS